QVVVIAPKDRLADAREIISRLDTTVAEEQSPIKFYKLANTTAAEVLATIRSLEGEQDETGSGATAGPAGPTAPGTRLPGRPTGRTNVNGPSGATGAAQTGMTREPSVASPAITPGATGAQRNPTLTSPAPALAPASAGGY